MSWRRATGAALALALGWGSSGCVNFSGKFGTPIATEYLDRIRDGETTRAEITAWFGPPSAFYNPTFLDVVLEDEEDIVSTGAPLLNDVYTYRFIQNDSTLFFVPVLFARISAVAVSETLTVFFDEEGRVAYHAYRRDEPRAAGER